MQTTTPNLAKWIIPVICLSGIITSLKAQILTDAFSYGSTPQAITTLTSNWTAHSAAGLNSILYQTNSLPAPNGYPEQGGGAISFAGGSGSREDINRTITTQSSGTVYAAALVNIASTGTDYFFHYNIASFVGRVFSSNSSGNLRFGISKTGTATVSSTNFAFNTTYLMVVKYEFVNGSANDIVSLWILTEPKTSEAEAGTALSTDAGGTDPASLVCVCIRQGTSSATGILDELRIANSWEDAVGTIVWNGSSWSNGTPLARNNIKLNSNLNLNSNLSCNNICFANNSNLQIGSNQLTVNGNIYGNGNLASDYNSELIIGGNAGTLNFASGSRNLKNLTLNANASASLGTILNLAPGTGFGTLTLNSNSTLNTNGFLFLKSDNNGTARMASIGAGATLNGEITQERFIPARRAYRFLCSAVTTNTGIANAWQQNTQITGQGTGFDASTSNNASMFYLDESTQQWSAITNTQTQNLVQGKGYRILIRGDRSIDLNNSSAPGTNCTLSAKGTHTSGDKTYNTSGNPAISGNINSYTLIGNPFLSAIDWNLVTRNNISSTYFTWRAQGGSNGKGTYVNYNASGNVSSDGDINSIIGSGSAFMIQTTGANPSITIKESDKVASVQGTQILGKSNPGSLRLKVYENDTQFVDGLFIYENQFAKPEKEEFDSEKWINPGFNLYSMSDNSDKLSIQGIPLWKTDEIIGLGMEKPEERTYKMEFELKGDFTDPLFLIDRYKGIEINLSLQSNYSFEVDKIAQSKIADRFYIRIGKSHTGVKENWVQSVSIYPNPVNDEINIFIAKPFPNSIQYNLYSNLGNLVAQGLWQIGETIPTRGLSDGFYTLKLEINGEVVFKKILKQ